ncbi:hypothetical protein QBC38DRAFT_477840 [Podospora fimiseda]|uniref:CSN8/PSMD8/EIF3K domain-containing protein n=1 Tax=Podospora fimiseda TaxID=252190 RepID=A0AAN7BQ20_9PEZI|nr:hypothetical protein QBC38DRAFT_477840 [Podospora fimiseda]
MQSSRHAQPSSSSSSSFSTHQRRGGRAERGGSSRTQSTHHHLSSRLKPLEIDPLSEYGLPSKGEKRLLSPKTQESYYSKIAERYLAICTDAGDRDNLHQKFSQLQISPSSTSSTPSQTDISLILSSLRKLREAIVASKRRDAFSSQVYLFAIRTGILASSYETYYPALLYLLRSIHPVHNLTSVEFHEVVSYLVLDTACRRGDLASAYALRNKYKIKDAKVDGVLKALVGDNWVLWNKMKRGVDGYRSKIMEFAEGDVKGQTLRALGRAYLSVPLGYLEGATGESWDVLRDKFKVGWELGTDGKVVIRRVQGKTG